MFESGISARAEKRIPISRKCVNFDERGLCLRQITRAMSSSDSEDDCVVYWHSEPLYKQATPPIPVKLSQTPRKKRDTLAAALPSPSALDPVTQAKPQRRIKRSRSLKASTSNVKIDDAALKVMDELAKRLSRHANNAAQNSPRQSARFHFSTNILVDSRTHSSGPPLDPRQATEISIEALCSKTRQITESETQHDPSPLSRVPPPSSTALPAATITTSPRS